MYVGMHKQYKKGQFRSQLSLTSITSLICCVSFISHLKNSPRSSNKSLAIHDLHKSFSYILLNFGTPMRDNSLYFILASAVFSCKLFNLAREVSDYVRQESIMYKLIKRYKYSFS